MGNTFRQLSILATLTCILVALYGLWGFQWPGVLPWADRAAFLRYLGCMGLIFGAVVLLSRLARLRPLVAGGIIVFVLLVLAGAFWPMVVAILFFMAAWMAGGQLLARMRTAPSHSDQLTELLAGVGLYGTIVSVLAHFPVNFSWLYGAGLLLPIWIGRRRAIRWFHKSMPFWRQPVDGLVRYWLDVGLATFAAVYCLVALFPEVGWDPLVTHLFVPGQLSERHLWGFDASLYALAVTPMLADWLFSIGYMLGGETAARLINVGVVLTLAALTHNLVIWAGGSSRAGRLAALLLLTTPLTFLEGSTLHVEGVLAVFLVGATLSILKIITSREADRKNGEWLLVGLFLGCALATKAITLLFLPALAGWLLWKWRTWVGKGSIKWVCLGLLSLFLFGMIPYANAWWLTGNPVFPFFNEIFQSSLAPAANFKDPRWQSGFTLDMLYAMTFDSGRYQEALTGAPGFQWLILLIPSLFLLTGSKACRGLLLMLLAGVSIVLVFSLTATYFRYVFPAMVLLMAAMAIALEKGMLDTGRAERAILAGGLAITLLSNTLFFNAASWYGDFQTGMLFGSDKRDAYMLERLPERAAVLRVNDLNISRSPVAVISAPFIADLQADALLASWYNLRFLQSVISIGSDDEAFNLLQENLVEYVILNRNWGRVEDVGNPFTIWFDDQGMVNAEGDNHAWKEGSQYQEQRIHIENVTAEVAAFGDISIRKLQ